MSENKLLQRNLRILVLNPNSSTIMTTGMVNAISSTFVSKSVELFNYTAPSSAPDSINNDEDIAASTKAVLDDSALTSELESDKYDAVLVACFSVHPLVSKLLRYQHLAVTGIFEASILTALNLLPAPKFNDKWGIVTTGKFWEKHLSDGVKEFLGQEVNETNHKFAGVFSTGLTAGDFHKVSPEEVRAKLREATQKLLNTGNVRCVVMGCGGMAGLEDIIRSTATETYGRAEGDRVFVLDGAKAGVMQLEGEIQSRQIFR